MSLVKVLAISSGIAIVLAGTMPDALARKSHAASKDQKVSTAESTERGAVADSAPDKDLEQVSKVLENSDRLIAAGKLDEAVDLLIGALKDYGENPHLRERLSRIYYLRGSVDDAIKELQVAISLDPTVFDYPAGVAWMYSMSGNYPESVKYAKMAIGLDATKAYPYVVMGFSLGCLGKRQQATEFLKRAIALESQNATAYLYLADVLASGGDYKQALPLYQKSLKLEPRTASAFVGLGDCFQKLGHDKEALSAYKRAVDLAPQDPTARGHLGFALSQTGDYMGAMRQGITANSIRIGQYWGKFMGMFVAVWAGIFIVFGTIFGAMFMGSRFNPVAGETVLHEFVLVFYHNRPGRFVITDRRIVFVPELVSRWFGTTRVSIQRDQVASVRTEKADDAGILIITSTSDTAHAFRVPSVVFEPIQNVLKDQGLYGEGINSLEATGANKAISEPIMASKADLEKLETEEAQAESNSFIAASFDFRNPDAVEIDVKIDRGTDVEAAPQSGPDEVPQEIVTGPGGEAIVDRRAKVSPKRKDKSAAGSGKAKTAKKEIASDSASVNSAPAPDQPPLESVPSKQKSGKAEMKKTASTKSEAKNAGSTETAPAKPESESESTSKSEET